MWPPKPENIYLVLIRQKLLTPGLSQRCASGLPGGHIKTQITVSTTRVSNSAGLDRAEEFAFPILSSNPQITYAGDYLFCVPLS